MKKFEKFCSFNEQGIDYTWTTIILLYQILKIVLNVKYYTGSHDKNTCMRFRDTDIAVLSDFGT